MLQDILINGGSTAEFAVNFVITHKDAILTGIGGAAGISVIAQTLIHKLNPKWEGLSDSRRKAYAYILVQALTAVTAICTYLVTNVNLEVLWPSLAAAVQFIHRLAISPVYVKSVLPFLKFQAEVKSAGVYGGEPVNTPQAAGVFVS